VTQRITEEIVHNLAQPDAVPLNHSGFGMMKLPGDRLFPRKRPVMANDFAP
jgi:hypothetical protein